MKRRIQIPFPFRAATGGAADVEASGTTALELIASVARTFPDLRSHLVTETGAPRSFVHFFANGREISRLDEELPASGTVELIPSVAGGGGNAHPG